ncbi:flagellar basal-body MS-ring/collar protein FliF [Desulfolucanica intricata]|uniref:flagellar basal-body MS-ring/collar protein FliF n=1 Tax=Desulfolucanica intricata TaxID=1285191 RepID=UPI0008301A81|nr:flagellar basal-body MS-ring/collar protein FliF [Desulfolucanica intricata]
MNPRELLDRLKKRWLALSQMQKVLVITAGAGLLAAIFYLIPILTKPTYVPLFTGLDQRDAGAVIEKLQDMKIEYELADQGQTINVQEDQVYEARIQLASSGILQGGGVGFELFDQNKMGVTDFERQVDYQRALQGELERTVAQLDEVEKARVHLVLPKESVFLDEQEPASASVALKLKPLAQLKPEQVRGIADLIAGSVEGLKLEDVHIIDMQGNILSEDIEAGSDDINSAHSTLKQQQVKRAYEKELEKRVQGMLNRILGPNRAVAMITADINFNKEEITSTTYDPGEIISRQEIEETNQGTEPGGMQEANGQGTTYPYGTNSESSSSREETITNYQLGNTQQTIVQAPGVLNRLSAAVVVDGNLTEERLEQIEALVSAAVGYDEVRGDQITVTNMAFDTSYQEQLKEVMGEEGIDTPVIDKQQLIYYVAAGMVILLLLALTVLIIRRRRHELEEPELVEESPKPIKDLFEEAEDEVNNNPYVDITQDKLKKMAREKPQQLADIIKVWLSED